MRRFVWTISKLVAVGATSIFLASSAGCVKRKNQLTKAEEEQIKNYILDDVPNDASIHRVDINYDNKVHLLGWKSEPAMAAPGSKVSLTLYWKKTGDLDAGWMVFTHVIALETWGPKPEDNAAEKPAGNLDCVGAIRVEKKENCTAQLYGPSDWEKGKVIVDSFDFTVPAQTQARSLRFAAGIGKWGPNVNEARLQIQNAEANDGQNRSTVILLPTGLTPPEQKPVQTGLANPPVPTINAPKFGKADVPKIDGKLDDAIWAKAGFSGPFVAPGDGAGVGPDHPVNATAKLGWDDQNLYVGIQVGDKDATSPFKPDDKDPHIWEKASGIELMVQPGDFGDNKNYFEIQIDANDAIWDTQFDDYNKPVDASKGQFGHMDWSAALKSVVVVDKGSGYTVEAAIPWKSFAVAGRGNTPPLVGDTWRMNFYSFKDGQRASLAWSPLLNKGNFHFAPRFGKVIFIDPSTVPQPPPSASASGAPSGVPSGNLKMAPGMVKLAPVGTAPKP